MKEVNQPETEPPLNKDNKRRSWVPGHRHSSSSWTNALQRLQNFKRESIKNHKVKREAKNINSDSESFGNNQIRIEGGQQDETYKVEPLKKKDNNPVKSNARLANTDDNHENPIRIMGSSSDQAHRTPKHKTHSRKESKHIKPPHCISGTSGELFYIGKHIGSGGYSRCYLAHTGAGRAYAVKTISKSPELSPSAIKQIGREIRIHQSLNHPRIVEFHQFIETGSHIFMVLDFCSNSTLHDIINQHGRFNETDACALLYQLVNGLKYLHANLIHHGDIKTSNILLDQNMRPKIADFGFSLRFKHATDYRTSLCGTPAYMAPEILRKPPKFGLLSDVWSLGIVGYAMLYGVTAFDAPDMEQVYKRISRYNLIFPEVRPQISQETIFVIFLMLSFEEESRPSAKSLAKRSWLAKCYEATCHPSGINGRNNDQGFEESYEKEFEYEKRAVSNVSALDKAKRLRSLFSPKTKTKYFSEATGINIGINPQDIRDGNQLIN